LAKAPSQIVVGAVVRKIEPDFAVVECENPGATAGLNAVAHCALQSEKPFTLFLRNSMNTPWRTCFGRKPNCATCSVLISQTLSQILRNGRGPPGNILKMSVEGTREQAYFARSEGVQCLTLLSSCSEKSSSISAAKSRAARGLRKEGEGGGDSRLLAPFQAKGLPQELLSKPGISLLHSQGFVT
jgi:hypothetical protein